MSAHAERLINTARCYWENGHVIPLDLFAQMNEAGLDVQRLEGQYLTDEE